MKKKIQRFQNLKIGQKLLICNVGIILIMSLFIGVIGYSISRNILMEKSEEQSLQLMEQLNSNYDYAANTLEDFVTSQTYNQEFSALLRMNPKDLESKAQYGRKKDIEALAYNLISFNKNIRTVLIQDDFEGFYYVSAGENEPDVEQLKACLSYEEAYEHWGQMYWKPFDEEQVFAVKLLFDFVSMKPVGAVAIGVDTSYFAKMYQNIAGSEAGVVLLNTDGEILIASDKRSRELAGLVLEKYPLDIHESQELYFRHKKYICTTWEAGKSNLQVLNLLSESEITAVIMQKLMRPFLYLAGTGILLSAGLALLVSGQISANIRLLLGSIQKVSRGEFSQQITPKSYDEIGMLAVEFNQMSQKIKGLLETVANEKVQKKNSELKALQFEYDALQAKINPHFLYNTLESMNSLAKLNGQKKLSDSIYLLGQYLREAISNRRKFVTLGEEIKNIRDYVEIQKLSYGDKISISIDTEEALEEAVMPKLLLQPLVENAILHGIEPKIGQGHIRIFAQCEKSDMLLYVEDDGVGIPEEKIGRIMNGEGGTDAGHTKVGLWAVHKRVCILYGESYGIRIKSSGEGTCILVRLPIRFDGEGKEDEL